MESVRRGSWFTGTAPSSSSSSGNAEMGLQQQQQQQQSQPQQGSSSMSNGYAASSQHSLWNSSPVQQTASYSGATAGTSSGGSAAAGRPQFQQSMSASAAMYGMNHHAGPSHSQHLLSHSAVQQQQQPQSPNGAAPQLSKRPSAQSLHGNTSAAGYSTALQSPMAPAMSASNSNMALGPMASPTDPSSAMSISPALSSPHLRHASQQQHQQPFNDGRPPYSPLQGTSQSTGQTPRYDAPSSHSAIFQMSHTPSSAYTPSYPSITSAQGSSATSANPGLGLHRSMLGSPAQPMSRQQNSGTSDGYSSQQQSSSLSYPARGYERTHSSSSGLSISTSPTTTGREQVSGLL